MHSGVIVFKQKGYIVPHTYLDLVSAKYPSCVGLGMIEDGSVMTQKIDCGGKPAEGLTKVKAAQEKFKANPMVFYFGSFPSGFHPDNIQPFDLIVSDKDDPIVAGFMDGDFTMFEDEKSTHSTAYNLAHDHLKPMLLEMYEDDAKDLFTKLDAPTSRRNIMLTSSTRGLVLLMSGEETITFNKDPNAMRREWVWGWTSNHLNFEGDKGVAEKTLNKLGEALMTAAAAVVPAPAEKEELEFPPSSIGKNDLAGLKKWYEKRRGFVPSNFKERPGVPKKKIVKSLEDLPKPDGAPAPAPAPAPAKPAAAPAPAPAPAPASRPAPAPAAAKSKAPAPAPAAVAEKEHEEPVDDRGDEETSDLIPIIPVGMRDAIQEFFNNAEIKRVIDRHSQEMLDPTIIAGLEDKRASFAEQVGFDGLDVTFTWPYEVLLELCRRTPEAAAILMMDYRALVAPVVKKTAAVVAAAAPAPAPARRNII